MHRSKFYLSSSTRKARKGMRIGEEIKTVEEIKNVEDQRH